MSRQEVLRRAAIRAEGAFAAWRRADNPDSPAYDRLEDAMVNLRHVLTTGKPYRKPRVSRETVSILDVVPARAGGTDG